MPGSLDNDYSGSLDDVQLETEAGSDENLVSATRWPAPSRLSARTGNVSKQANVARTIISDTEHNGFGSLALVGDRLITVYRRGPSHGVATNASLRLRYSDDFGETWSEPQTILSDASMDEREGILHLHSNGTLYCFVCKSAVPDVDASRVVGYITSTDDGATWSSFTALSFTTLETRIVIEGSVCELDDGNILIPVYGKFDSGDSRRSISVIKLNPDGSTSDEVLVAQENGSLSWGEPNLVKLQNGTILMTIRELQNDLAIYTSTSSDDGATWTAPTSRFSGEGRPAVFQWTSGGVTCMYRSLTGNGPQAFRTSWDNGATWSGETLFDAQDFQGAYAFGREVTTGVAAVVYGVEDNPSEESSWYFQYLLDEAPLSSSGTNASRPTAGIAGRIYQTTDNPRALWMDDVSDWTLIGPMTVTRSTATSTITTDATLTDDDVLLFPVKANTKYIVEGFILATAANANMDVKYGWSVPAGTVMDWGASHGSGANIAGYGASIAATARVEMLTEAESIIVGTLNGTSGAHLLGYIETSSTAGNVVLQWAQGSSDGGTLAIAKGSALRVTRLA